MGRLKSKFLLVPALLSTALVGGCSVKTDDLAIQSKFTYPNGEYTSLGHVKSEKSSVSFVTGPEFNREVFQELHQKALESQPNADAIVNYVLASEVTLIPMLPISFTTFYLEGTAIKLLEVKDRPSRTNVPTAPSPAPAPVKKK
jgi:hypothetical protein